MSEKTVRFEIDPSGKLIRHDDNGTTDMDRAFAKSLQKDALRQAKKASLDLAARLGEITMDDVCDAMKVDGHNPQDLGPASGSVFKSKAWEFTGKYVKSRRPENHGRLLRVWRRKGGAE